jgi:hypothetical protein
MSDDYAKAYNRDPFIKKKDFLSSYHCNMHEGWHVGHKTSDLPPHIRIQKILDGLDNE